MTEMEWIHYLAQHAGAPGHNEYGVPLHACWGYRHDAHYWTWIAHRVELNGGPW